MACTMVCSMQNMATSDNTIIAPRIWKKDVRSMRNREIKNFSILINILYVQHTLPSQFCLSNESVEFV